jgi:hypothetical protein
MLKGEKMNDFVNNTLSMVIIGDKEHFTSKTYSHHFNTDEFINNFSKIK